MSHPEDLNICHFILLYVWSGAASCHDQVLGIICHSYSYNKVLEFQGTRTITRGPTLAEIVYEISKSP